MKNASSSTAFRYGNLSISLANPCTQPSKCGDLTTPRPECAQPSKCPDLTTPAPACTQPSKCPDLTTPGKPKPRGQATSPDLFLLQEQLKEELKQL